MNDRVLSPPPHRAKGRLKARRYHLQINGHSIEDHGTPFLIAEIGQAHEGSLGMAHAYIDAVADAGADAVKFQTHIAAAESTRDEVFRVPMGNQDASRYDYWQRMEFTESQWLELAEHSAKRNLTFLSSAFSVQAVELLERVGVPAWKLGSGEIGSIDLLDAMVATGKPILLSTGMSAYSEIEDSVGHCRSGGVDFAILQCTSKYPLPLDQVGLNVLDELRTRFAVPIGLSDHSGSIWPAVAAIAMGAAIVEVHVVLDRRSFGPDAEASVTSDELRQIAQARDAITTMRSTAVDKDAMATELAPMRELFSKSVALVSDLPVGTVLARSHLTLKKPGTGIAPAQMADVVGRRLVHDVPGDRLLREEDLDV